MSHLIKQRGWFWCALLVVLPVLSPLLALAQVQNRGKKVVRRDVTQERSMTRRTNPKDGAELLLIPAGLFLMGDNEMKHPHSPRHTVTLSAYWIYKNLVTVGMYEKFCKATRRKMPDAPDFNPKWIKKDHPIVNVSWYDAKEYCDWVGASLPSEAQWEKAARGTEGRRFPWGNTYQYDKLWRGHLDLGDKGGTARVGSFPDGASPFGSLDMVGNVGQWCDSSLGPSDKEKIIRGGGWGDAEEETFLCAYHFFWTPDFSNTDLGFRCIIPLGLSQ